MQFYIIKKITKMEKDLSGLELIKKLNSERTQGEWVLANERDVILNYADGRVLKNGFEVDIQQSPSRNCIVSFRKAVEFREKTIADAQYTALAVNNFAAVCEALQKVSKDAEQFILNPSTIRIVEQALNNIKL